MTPLRKFVIKHPILMNLVPGVSYWSPLSIDTKMKINKLCKYLLTKTWKTLFLCFSHWKYRLGRSDPTRTFDFWRDTLTPLKVVWRWYLWFFFAKMTAKDELTTIYKRLVKYLGVLVQSEKNLGGHSDPPPPLVRRGLNYFKWQK